MDFASNIDENWRYHLTNENNQQLQMKKETTIILAGSFGALAVLGFLAISKFLKTKKFKNYYHQFKALQEIQSADEGIEYYGLR